MSCWWRACILVRFLTFSNLAATSSVANSSSHSPPPTIMTVEATATLLSTAQLLTLATMALARFMSPL